MRVAARVYRDTWRPIGASAHSAALSRGILGFGAFVRQHTKYDKLGRPMPNPPRCTAARVTLRQVGAPGAAVALVVVQVVAVRIVVAVKVAEAAALGIYRRAKVPLRGDFLKAYPISMPPPLSGRRGRANSRNPVFGDGVSEYNWHV